MKPIKAVVFDFGNVIINIDVNATLQAFADLTFKPISKIQALFKEAEIFNKFETGFYSEEEFRDAIRQTLSYPLNDNEIDEAWNTLLLDVPKDRIDFLENLKYDYPIYLLSNTNSIHIRKCKQIFRNQHNIQDFTRLFSKVFLSYEMGLMKPDYQIYKKMIDSLGLDPEEILFLDDNADNINAAADMGIRTIKINPPESFVPLLEKLL